MKKKLVHFYIIIDYLFNRLGIGFEALIDY